jgi:hypothetical protein
MWLSQTSVGKILNDYRFMSGDRQPDTILDMSSAVFQEKTGPVLFVS